MVRRFKALPYQAIRIDRLRLQTRLNVPLLRISSRSLRVREALYQWWYVFHRFEQIFRNMVTIPLISRWSPTIVSYSEINWKNIWSGAIIESSFTSYGFCPIMSIDSVVVLVNLCCSCCDQRPKVLRSRSGYFWRNNSFHRESVWDVTSRNKK